MNKQEETVTITRTQYEALVEDSKVLDALRAGGVDNWEWYEASLEEHYDEQVDYVFDLESQDNN